MLNNIYVEMITFFKFKTDEEIEEIYKEEGRKVVFIKRIPQDKKVVYVAFKSRRKEERETKE